MARAATPKAHRSPPRTAPERGYPDHRSTPICESPTCSCGGCLDGFTVAPWRCRECRCHAGIPDCAPCGADPQARL